MESRFRVLFLIAVMITLSGCAATKNLFGFGDEETPPPSSEPPGQVIDPEVERREIKEPAIDKEDFEVGAFAGVMSIEDFTNAKWELGILAGDFGGANIVSLYGGYSLNPYVSVEVWGSQILGNFSNGWMGSVNVVHEAFPEWRVSPFFTLGAGVIHTEPKSTIVQGEDRTDQIGHVGAGFRIYATRRFVLRAEYKSYVVFTSRDDNEEVEEWKVGFAFFF